jgi:hypothetical protein
MDSLIQDDVGDLPQCRTDTLKLRGSTDGNAHRFNQNRYRFHLKKDTEA